MLAGVCAAAKLGEQIKQVKIKRLNFPRVAKLKKLFLLNILGNIDYNTPDYVDNRCGCE